MAPQFQWAPNNNFDPGGPGFLNLIFPNHFKWAPNNNFDPGGPGPLNLIFANQFINPPTIIFKWPLTIILIQGARASSI